MSQEERKPEKEEETQKEVTRTLRRTKGHSCRDTKTGEMKTRRKRDSPHPAPGPKSSRSLSLWSLFTGCWLVQALETS